MKAYEPSLIVACFLEGLRVDHSEKETQAERFRSPWGSPPPVSWEARLDKVEDALMTDYGSVVARRLIQTGAVHLGRPDAQAIGRAAEAGFNEGNIYWELICATARERGSIRRVEQATPIRPRPRLIYSRPVGAAD